MATFQSKLTTIEAERENIFLFLSDFSNFRNLLPPDITDWKNELTWCSFSIKGVPNIKLEISEVQPYSKISYKTAEGKPIDLTITTTLEFTGNKKTEVLVTIEAELNAFLKMIVAKPLQHLSNTLAEKLKEETEKL